MKKEDAPRVGTPGSSEHHIHKVISAPRYITLLPVLLWSGSTDPNAMLERLVSLSEVFERLTSGERRSYAEKMRYIPRALRAKLWQILSWRLTKKSFRDLRRTYKEIILPPSSGEDCSHGPCMTDSTVCGDLGECDDTIKYKEGDQ